MFPKLQHELKQLKNAVYIQLAGITSKNYIKEKVQFFVEHAVQMPWPQMNVFSLNPCMCVCVLVFFRLFENAEEHSFMPLIMMIECNFPCSNGKTNMYKN